MNEQQHITIRVSGALLERLDKLQQHIQRVHYPAKPTTNRSDLLRAALGRGVLTLELEQAHSHPAHDRGGEG